jgi:origin recognition complex subunit 4
VTTALSVIFILEEFDLFATHPRQTLLYNLFDIAQSRKAPIAVVGTTTRIDVVESLEKRVKSRFSHRTVHLKNPATLKGFWEICREGLGVDMDEVYGEIAELSEEDRHCFEAWNKHIEVRPHPSLPTSPPTKTELN